MLLVVVPGTILAVAVVDIATRVASCWLASRDAAPALSLHITGECVPLRVFLKPYALTPTYRATNKFTVKYFLNLVLVDEEDRRCRVTLVLSCVRFGVSRQGWGGAGRRGEEGQVSV